MRIATYHRCSTVDQNPQLCRDELRAAAARLGDLVMEVEEQGSGSRNDRPGLQSVLQAARKGKLDAVLVWKLDRWGRSALDLLSNIRALENAGVRFICTSQGLDVRPGGDAMSNLVVQVLAALAEFQRATIIENTKVGLAKVARDEADPRKRAARRAREKKAIGRPSSLPPGGAAKVRELRAAGRSWSEIAKAVGCSPWAARRAVMAAKEAA